LKSSAGYEGASVLDVMSLNALNRNAEVVRLIKSYLRRFTKNSPFNVLDFGAGKGEFLNVFSLDKTLTTHAVEPDISFHSSLFCAQKYYGLAEIASQSMDFIYSVDVMEHVENDLECLRGLQKVLKSGGGLILYLPARQELYCDFDRAIGHWRRYNLDVIRNRLETSGFRIETLRYHDCLGYFAAWYNKIRPYHGNLEPRLVRFYDRFLFPIGNYLERLISPPFGKSLYVFARKI